MFWAFRMSFDVYFWHFLASATALATLKAEDFSNILVTLLLALPANIRLVRQTNNQAYVGTELITAVKSFMIQAPGQLEKTIFRERFEKLTLVTSWQSLE
jgi:hypothetical protein